VAQIAVDCAVTLRRLYVFFVIEVGQVLGGLISEYRKAA
jgi:hypothetical protein